VADDDPPLPGHGQVEAVRADPADGGHAELRQRAQGVARPLHGAARVHQADRVTGPRQLLLQALGPIGVEDDVAVRLEPVEVRRALDLRGIVPGHDDDDAIASGHADLRGSWYAAGAL